MKLRVAFAALLLSSLAAQAAGPLHVVLEAYRVVASDAGKQELQAASDAKPGDVLEYRAVYRNDSTQPLHNVVATLPIPASGVHYLPDASALRAAHASLDGKSFAALPLKRTVLLNGRRIEQLVPTSEYRFLRWTLGDLPAGSSKAVSARVRIVDLDTIAANR